MVWVCQYYSTIIIDKVHNKAFLSEIFFPKDGVGLDRQLSKPTFLSEIISGFSLCFQCFPYPASDKNKFLITTKVSLITYNTEKPKNDGLSQKKNAATEKNCNAS